MQCSPLSTHVRTRNTHSTTRTRTHTKTSTNTRERTHMCACTLFTRKHECHARAQTRRVASVCGARLARLVHTAPRAREKRGRGGVGGGLSCMHKNAESRVRFQLIYHRFYLSHELPHDSREPSSQRQRRESPPSNQGGGGAVLLDSREQTMSSIAGPQPAGLQLSDCRARPVRGFCLG